MGGFNLNPESANIEDVMNQAGPPQPAPQAQPQAPPQQAQQPSGNSDLLEQAFQQQYQEYQSARNGDGPAIKGMLQNFFGAMSHGLMPIKQNADYRAQRALTNMATLSASMSQDKIRSMTAQNMMRSPTSPDLERFGIPAGTMMTPAEQVQAISKYSQIAQQGQNAIATQETKGEGALALQDKKNLAPVKPSAANREARFIQLAGVDPSTWKDDDREFMKGYIDWVKVNKTDPGVARFVAGAKARASMTPFETVEPGTNIPKTISNLQAVASGAPKVPLGTQLKLGGNYALFNDAYKLMDNIDAQANKVNLDDPAVRARITAAYQTLAEPASKGLTGQFLSSYLANQPINNQLKSSDERNLVLSMAQAKAAGTGLRGILGQAGTNEMQQRLDSALMPGPTAIASKRALLDQTKAMRGFLNRFSVGQPQVGLNAPGPTALSNAAPEHTAGGQAQGLKEGATGTGSDGKKYIVRGGTWVLQ